MGLFSLPVIYLEPNYGGGIEDNGDLLQKVPCRHYWTQCLWTCSRPLLILASTGDSWTLIGKSRSVSCGVTAPFSWVLVHKKFCLHLLESVSLGLFKFWQLYGRVNGDLLQEGLSATQACCNQSPCPCSRPQLTHTSTKESQALKGTSDSVSVGFPTVHKVLFEPSERFWQVWSLIPNTILFGLLLSCWGLSFALGCGVSLFGGIQHSPVNGCSVANYNLGVLSEEDGRTSFYSIILDVCKIFYDFIHTLWFVLISS